MNSILQAFTFAATLAFVMGNWIQEKECRGAEQPCYQSSQCCEGFVCAAYPENYGAIPEFPGQCVKEKDEHFCQEDRDCATGHTCAKVGSLAGRDINMCVEKTESKRWYHYSGAPVQNKIVNADPKKGRRGDACADSSQCGDGLCCQLVARFRQKAKQVCEPFRHPSKCIRAKGTYHTNEVFDF